MIYGTNSKQLGTESVFEKCPYCGVQTNMTLYVFQEYVHFLWIPAIPAGKKEVCQCENCRKVIQLQQMSTSLKLISGQLKSRSKTPIWTFTGLALIFSLVAIGIFNYQRNKVNSSKFISTPAKDDIYEIKVTSSRFTVYKVNAVEMDSVFVKPSLYETNLESGIPDLISKESYDEEIFGIAKKDLKKMFDNKEIINVHRK